MSKYDYDSSIPDSEIEIQFCIANELAEMNRLKRIEMTRENPQFKKTEDEA